eukprot:CAMPEP_0115094576 /NCGR_PEP_ID=MMETSP0227-20121206/28450_1 /TAXON_ID=89957 /ORGANISM="Polarella glacialis, Strain CCMP 1383" /LENGTH=155 /DNA_ID=CAMNT_0002487625 /DNA_START=341 /DNA_END=808 /DNA_ORIENTATION=+
MASGTQQLLCQARKPRSTPKHRSSGCRACQQGRKVMPIYEEWHSKILGGLTHGSCDEWVPGWCSHETVLHLNHVARLDTICSARAELVHEVLQKLVVLVGPNAPVLVEQAESGQIMADHHFLVGFHERIHLREELVDTGSPILLQGVDVLSPGLV